jgi:hypothetical protein
VQYFENDKAVLDWFDRALTHPTAHIRRQALLLLEHVDCTLRASWLERGQRDPDASVAATAVVVARIAPDPHWRPDLLESDLATGVDAEDLQWEWEYELVVCDRFTIPGVRTLAWSKTEDDGLAREIALMKNYAGKEHEKQHGTAVIVSKRLVTRYTRGARTFTEALRWHHEGRPRYPGT